MQNPKIKLYHQYIELILNLKKSTPNFMIYGELGIYHMSVYIELRMINFWSKMINGKDSKIANILYISYWDLIDKLCNLPFFNTSYIALYALLIKTFFAFVKLPVLEKFRPRYVNSLTISIAFPVYLMRSKENLIFI
jgi:hypothetical protein